MNATDTIILECNNAESIQARSAGLPSFTKLDKSTWTNNFESIEINRGDTLTMEYAIINQIGGSEANSIEFPPIHEKVEDREYNSNSVIFELEFYINHNAINSVGLPLFNWTTNSIETDTQTNLGFYSLHTAGDNSDWNSTMANADNIQSLRSINRLLYTDSKKYTLLHPYFSPKKVLNDVQLNNFTKTDKRWVQYQVNKNFITPDNLANDLTIKFHETDTNPPRLRGSQLPLVNNYDIGALNPSAYKNYSAGPPPQLTAEGFYTLNKNTWISRACNGVEVQVDISGETTQITTLNSYSQVAVLNPYKWIGGTYLNNCSTYNMIEDTDINTSSVAQVYPRVMTRYLSGTTAVNMFPHNGPLASPNGSFVEENMPVFTNILATEDNIDKIKKYFDFTRQYWGDLLDEDDALKNDENNWDSMWDIGRSDDSHTDIGMALGTTGESQIATFGLTNGTYICPTTNGKCNNQGINPTLSDVELHRFQQGGGLSVKPFFIDINNNAGLVKTSVVNSDGVEFEPDSLMEINTNITSNEADIETSRAMYNYAKSFNIGVYPYYYYPANQVGQGVAKVCLCVLTSKFASKTPPNHFSTGNYFGFSPSFYDNHGVLLINKDASADTNSIGINPNPYLNVGASDVDFSFDPTLGAFTISSLHTARRRGALDDVGTQDGLGNEIVVVNEVVGYTGASNPKQFNYNALNGRDGSYLDYSNEANPRFKWSSTIAGTDINIGYSDSIAGIFIKDIYFGKPNYNPNQLTSAEIIVNPDLLNSSAVKASKENWYGSLLWKMGATYEDIFSQFTNLSRGLRFNNAYWRNKSQTRSVAPLTTNTNIDCSLSPFINVVGSYITPSMVVGSNASGMVGVVNYQLGYNNLEAVILSSPGSSAMIFSGEMKKSETGFYRIYTDFCHPTYLDGNGGNLNVIGLALKSYNSNDFFYSYSPSYVMVADRNFVLSNITTSIRNSDGNLANVGDRCVIVYKITKPKLILEPPDKTKDSSENDLEDIVDELKELNETTDMNNMILRGGSGASAGGGGLGGGGASGRKMSRNEINPIVSSRDKDKSNVKKDLGSFDGDASSSAGTFTFLDGSTIETGDATEDISNFDDVKSDLTNQLILNILDRVPLSQVMDNGKLNENKYISIVSRDIRNLYDRFITRFNKIMPQLQNSRGNAKRMAQLSDELQQIVGGVEINPDGESFISVPSGQRRDIGKERINARITSELVKELTGMLDEGSSPGDLELFIRNSVKDDNIDLQIESNNTNNVSSRRRRRNEMRVIPKSIKKIINTFKNMSDENNSAVKLINEKIKEESRNEPETREARQEQEVLLTQLNRAKQILQGGRVLGKSSIPREIMERKKQEADINKFPIQKEKPTPSKPPIKTEEPRDN